jgi:argininosuccinate lyase
MPEQPRAVWQGRLAAGLDPRAQRLNDSLPVDARLVGEELALSRAYATTLAECGVMTQAERDALVAGCDSLEADLGAGRAALAGEDVHSAVEAALDERAPAAGGAAGPARRLHTGRSRNDQVATLLRMHVMGLCDAAIEGARDLERALVRQAREAGDLLCASFTHLQPAQPMRLAHWWLAHVEAFARDEERFAEAREAADRLPLGAGAVAGTPLRYDRAALATRLGFSRVALNSLDAVGDRDFALQYLNAAAMLGVHLSRLAEDLVIFCSPAFGWFAAPDGFSTGSSLLPQKRNPDLFELARGKCARLLANAQSLAALLKGLPSSYQKDLQEDKEAVFDTADTLELLLAALPPAIAALAPDRARLAASLTPDLLAVELADALVAEGVAFRDAHGAVGALWAAAERAAVEPVALPLSERLALSPHFTDARLAGLSYEAAVARRTHPPGTGSTAHQLALAEARLGLGPGGDADVPAPEDVVPPAGAPPGRPRPDDVRPKGGPVPSWMVGPVPSSHGGGSGGPPGGAGGETATDYGRPVGDGLSLRRARIGDVPGIAGVMAPYVVDGTLLPRPVSELYQCVREFHVVERAASNGTPAAIVACAALRLLWRDLGEVRSLAVRPDAHGRGLGAALVEAVVADARALDVPRVIALTREVGFFQRSGFVANPRESLPRKVWTDCVRCPKRHACDEVAMILDLVPGASEEAARQARSYVLPMPAAAESNDPSLPVIS